MKTLTGHTDYVCALLQLSDGMLVCGSSNYSIKLRDVMLGVCEKTLTGHTYSVRALFQLSDGI